jgi:hypothetical protein
LGISEDQLAICPEFTYGDPCPVCEHRRELKDDGADDDTIKALVPKQRNIYQLICYDSEKEEDRGVQVWDVSWHYMEKFLKKLASQATRRKKRKATGKVVDPFVKLGDPTENGHNVIFTIEKARGEKDFDQFIGHTLEERDYELSDEVLEQAIPMDQHVTILSYEELHELYFDEKYEKDEDEEEDKDDEEEERPRTRKRSRGKSGRGRRYEEEEEEEERPRTRKRRGKRSEELECPEDGEFGADYDDFDACETCDLWKECSEKYDDEYSDGD